MGEAEEVLEFYSLLIGQDHLYYLPEHLSCTGHGAAAGLDLPRVVSGSHRGKSMYLVGVSDSTDQDWDILR